MIIVPLYDIRVVPAEDGDCGERYAVKLLWVLRLGGYADVVGLQVNRGPIAGRLRRSFKVCHGLSEDFKSAGFRGKSDIRDSRSCPSYSYQNLF